jgi:site-specific DNA-methyltransferase (adenine-specific)
MTVLEKIFDILPNKLTDNIIFTPIKIVDEMLNMLPEEVWSNLDATFLDPCTKSGIFLRRIYDRLMDDKVHIQKYKDKQERSNYIFEKQLYGISLDETTLVYSERTLYGKMYMGQRNIRYIDNYIEILKNKKNINYKEAIEKEFGQNMKFDIIIGNPPYQSKTQSIYNFFIDSAIKLKPYIICMITKNNWLSSDTLKDVRNNMIDFGIEKVINYSKMSEIFDVGVAVSIFKLLNGYSEDTTYTEIVDGNIVEQYSSKFYNGDIIFSHKLEENIFNKVRKDLHSNGTFGECTLPAEAFRINSNGTVGRNENKYTIDDFENKSDHNNVAIAYMDNNRNMYFRYTSLYDLPARSELVNTYKIISGEKFSKSSGQVLTNLHALDKMSVCSGSYVCLYYTEDKNELLNVAQYIKTRFFRFLVYLKCDSGMVGHSAYRFSAVPLQDFTSNSDLDWSQPISDIEQQLYKKYNLTDEEIAYIEKTIKPME